MPTTARPAPRDAGMEGWVARWYARTRAADMADFRSEAVRVAARLPAGGAVLEVAPGPGYFAIELAQLGGFAITGLDISRSFVRMATDNAAKAGVRIAFCLGNAADMPLPDDSFDLVYCSAAFKNFAEPVKALDEMHRVLHPGGEALIVDLRKDVSLAEIDAYVRRSGRTRLDAWITRQAFRRMLIGRAYTAQAFERMAAASRFGSGAIRTEAIGIELALRKQQAAN